MMKNNTLPSVEEVGMLFQSFKNCCNRPDKSLRSESVINDGGSITPENEVVTVSALDQLMKMEGLENVKVAIQKQLSYASIMKMRKDLGLKVPQRVFNIILTGDPGTGKTTVGSLIGRIFHENGLLSKGHIVQATRASLVGRYIGETEANTTRAIQEAQGGVLMIDEIYSLTSEVAEGQENTRDFGVKVIDTLLPVISDPNSDIIVVGCGYKKQMHQFLKANPGIASRFNVVIDFPNFSFDQLWAITMMKLEEFDFSISEEGQTAVRRLIEQAMKIKNFGNGRFAVSLAETYLIPAVCSRIFKSSLCENMTKERLKALSIVEPSDVPALEEMFPLSGRERNAVGFKS